ncbi:MerR family transcriptional regulator [Listeria ivanovii]|uniref:MerR family transcription regulator n=2 Tax=Listeria ivanovii TaxID=1638 RepID=Q5DU77_LISIV|nr:MerR family transcriptional regulator [Listeria ivanovii]AHI55743.1 MerR family transcriptional regulator [Listeria ivanovii WSLC3009]MBK3914658.1 MerR family transcriptional regulator [Listeria ivanovii subsp. ivanovii]MBK3921444.1 MerR family transcriptional regulator [Listeria ivanovii subsp. ivanovii]MBK3926608.1 MerR family transcriptional regulator [Listeria ivanovii subsp. ivanovii]MCJ1717684.1 MerR family transcriptional regulator [Listeria ivanovii]
MTYTIKEVATIMNISAHTLRFYDDHGLFPFVHRDKNNVRQFSEKDLEWVYVVQCLRTTGLPIEQVKHYINMCVEGDATTEERYNLMLQQREVMRAELQKIEKQLKMLDYKTQYYHNILFNEKKDLHNPFIFDSPIQEL